MPSLIPNSLPSLLLLGSGLLASVGAVTIKLSNFGNGALCSGPVVLTCTAIAIDECCNPRQFFDEALFSGLPTTAVGAVYNGGGAQGGCTGTASQTGYGLNLCLSRGGTGANWYDVNPGKKRGEKNCKPVLPSAFSIGNRTFKINGDVPPEISEEMMSLFNSSRGIAEVPEVPQHFAPHEII